MREMGSRGDRMGGSVYKDRDDNLYLLSMVHLPL